MCACTVLLLLLLFQLCCCCLNSADGGNVPVVVMFKKGQGNVADTIKQLQAGKASSQYPLDGVFIATGNVSFVAGEDA
jgi:hypothetical protein